MKVKSPSSRSVDTVAIVKRAHFEWERGRRKRAFALFLQASMLGDPQHNLGYFYDVGIGTRRNRQKALFWYKKVWAADQQTSACINIALLYASEKNSRQAVFWWRKAISRGDGDAALDLAKFYLSKGGDRNKTRALALLRKVRTSRGVTEGSIEEAAEILQVEKA